MDLSQREREACFISTLSLGRGRGLMDEVNQSREDVRIGGMESTPTGNGLGAVVAAPFAALAFLTVLPVPASTRFRAHMGWAVACFPLVGAAMGASLGALDHLLAPVFPSSVSAALLVVGLLALTGALHLDALMDSFDGLFGGKNPAARLAIMKDSRVGSFGIAAAVSLLLIEYGSLLPLPSADRSTGLILALVLSRWAMAVVLWAFPAATESGLAAGLKPLVRWPHAVLASLIVLAIVSFVGGARGLGLGLLGLLIAVLGGRFAVARLGGVNGDVCGGLGEVVEASVLMSWVALAAR